MELFPYGRGERASTLETIDVLCMLYHSGNTLFQNPKLGVIITQKSLERQYQQVDTMINEYIKEHGCDKHIKGLLKALGPSPRQD